MKKQHFISFTFLFVFFYNYSIGQSDKRIDFYTVDLKNQSIAFFWKNDNAKPFASILNLKNELEAKNQKLIFAMNGGMYQKDLSPQGLYTENGKVMAKIDTSTKGYGNFYMMPNGVFYLTSDNKGYITPSKNFKNNYKVTYATQSGPMLVVDSTIHPMFNKYSTNINIRNGVGVMADGKILFAISNTEINFYDFALFFLSHGCRNALYLDGYVSRMYLPEKKWYQTDGNFGVIIGVTEPQILRK